MLKTLLPLIAAAAMTASSASAANYASEVLFWTGEHSAGSKRSDVEHALNGPDQEFLSLGLGGYADFGFGGTFSGSGVIFEITDGNRSGYLETADLWVGNRDDDSSFKKIGSVTNSTGDAINFTFSGVFDTLRVVDTSPVFSRRDGFDIDAVGVTLVPDQAPAPIPLPASALLLGAGLASLGVARKIKR